MFPFELDGVRVIAIDEIEYQATVWRPGLHTLPGQVTMRRNWLLAGASVSDNEEAEVWLSDDGAMLEPSVGPAWEGEPYIPTPAYVREQVIRRRAGLPPKDREWQPIRPNPGRRGVNIG